MVNKPVGITLVELLATLLIVMILLGYALPSLQSLATRIEADSYRDVFARMIYTARHAAIIHNANVVLCPGGQTGCAGRNRWHQGTVAFVDKNHNREIDDDDFTIAFVSRTHKTNIRWRSFRNRGYLRFTPMGLTDWQNGHFLFCPVNGNTEHARQIVVNRAGRIYYSKDDDNDGIQEDVQGRALSC